MVRVLVASNNPGKLRELVALDTELFRGELVGDNAAVPELPSLRGAMSGNLIRAGSMDD